MLSWPRILWIALRYELEALGEGLGGLLFLLVPIAMIGLAYILGGGQ